MEENNLQIIYRMRGCMHAKSLQSCSVLCGPMDYSPLGSSVHRILQARRLEWVAISSCRGSSRPRDWISDSCVSCIGGQVLYYKCHLGSPSEGLIPPNYKKLIQLNQLNQHSVVSDSLQLHGLYTVHGILQARILEWIAFPFSRGSSQPRDRTQVSRIAGGFITSWATRDANSIAKANKKPMKLKPNQKKQKFTLKMDISLKKTCKYPSVWKSAQHH